MKYKVSLCDDDLAQASNLALKLGIAAMMQPEEVELEIGTTAQSANEVLNYLNEHRLDGGIYFLDIELTVKTFVI